MSILEVKNIDKIYKSRLGTNQYKALSNVSFSVEEGEFVAIMGESGSGKTTLLNVLSTLDKSTDGQIFLDEQDISKIRENKLAEYRRENIGFVFQDFSLIDTFSVKDNIALPLVLSNTPVEKIENRVSDIADTLRISHLLDKQPYEISGGEKQRVAVARALITDPKIIFADEPTGALDSKTSNDLLDVLNLINEKGKTILMVTHSVNAASRGSRVLIIKDGKLVHQIYKGDSTTLEMNKKITEAMSMISVGGE